MGVITLRVSISDAGSDNADESACGYLRFKTVTGSLTDDEWQAFAEQLPNLKIECIAHRKSIRFQSIKKNWDVKVTGTARFGSLKVTPAKRGYILFEIVLDDDEHEGIVAELSSGDEVLKQLAESVNWRTMNPSLPLRIESCSYDTLDGTDFASEESDDEPQDTSEPVVAPSATSQEHQKRLFDLRMKMNQARALNRKQIQEEEARLTETPAQRKKRLEREYRKRQQEEREQHPLTKEDKEQQLLHETAESVEAQRVRENNKNPAAFGWDVFNQDALYRAYKKRTKNIPVGAEIDIVDAEDAALNYGLTPRPSNAAIDNMVAELTATHERRSKFSRRRQFYEDETVSYINERNRVFNKKVARFFDPYTQELKANIEKGTG